MEKKAVMEAPFMITLEHVKNYPEVRYYISKADEFLGNIGYTEHGERHASYVAQNARRILQELGYEERLCELAAIAGYIHDIGNVVNRPAHPETGAMLAHHFLREMGMPIEDVLIVMGAVGNHDEGSSDPVNEVCAALIIADKSDVHRSRVRTPKEIRFDIHDRVNYAVKRSQLKLDTKNKTFILELEIDKEISDMVEYFEIFTTRMVACRRAAKALGCGFDVAVSNSNH